MRIERRLQVAADAPVWVSEGENAFDQFVRDDDAQVPDFIYDHVARRLGERKDESIRAETREGFDPAKCLADPAAFRGRFWRVAGRIVRVWPEPLDAGAPVSRVFAGVFYPEKGFPVFFHVIEKPDALELLKDTVEIDGLFVKVIRYTTPSGRTVTAPFFMARSVRRLM